MRMSKLVAVIFMAPFFLASCTSERDARRALEAEDFTDITMTGYAFFACAKDDFYHTGFEASNSHGKRISGVVCSGLFFKNATIRY